MNVTSGSSSFNEPLSSGYILVSRLNKPITPKNLPGSDSVAASK